MSSRKRRRALQSRAPEPRARRRTIPALPLPRGMLWFALALVAATAFAYAPALRAPFVMDDAETIAASAKWESPSGSPTSGRPVVLATLAANYAVNRALGVDQRRDPDGPNKAVGYRVFNLLVHLLTGALLFGVLRRALREAPVGAEWRAAADGIAGTVCALWLLHPIQSEVINYIVQRSEAMASLFYLGTLYASIRAWDAEARVRLGWYALAVTSCALGMLTKEVVISVPLAVMLYDRAFRLPTWRALFAPGDGRGWLYTALWCIALGTFAVIEVGARGDTAGFGGISWDGYLYTQCWAIAHYLRLVLWPSPLAIDYGFRAVQGARGIPGAVLLVAFAIATIVAWTRAPRYGWFAFCGSVFFMVLAPSSSVIPVTSEVAAERRVYLVLAIALLFAVLAVEQLRRRVKLVLPAPVVIGGVGALAALLAVTTAARSAAYQSNESLWRSAVRATPDNPRALGNLGWALYRLPVPQVDSAESMYRRAMALDSTCHFGCLQFAAVLAKNGKLAEAEPLLERELAIARGSGIPLTERALGLVLMQMGDDKQAIPYLEDVAHQFPTMDHVVVLGVAYLSAGRRDDALGVFKGVARLDGGSEQMQHLSTRLTDAAPHPEALESLRQFAWTLSKDWM
jgi:tetratricopeptide (TPR) repeat protein